MYRLLSNRCVFWFGKQLGKPASLLEQHPDGWMAVPHTLDPKTHNKILCRGITFMYKICLR